MKWVVFLSFFVALSFPQVSFSEIIFLDDYQGYSIGDTLTQYSPLIGEYSQLTTGGVDVSVVSTSATQQELRLNDNSTSLAYAVVASPVIKPTKFSIEYDFRVDSIAPSQTRPTNVLVHELVLDPVGTNVFLYFGYDGTLYTRKSTLGTLTGVIDTGFDWVMGTQYNFLWFGDAALDIVSLAINDNAILEWGVDFNALRYFGMSSTFINASTATVDNLSISTPIPEPSTFLLLSAGLAGLGFVVRRRRKE